MDPAPNPRIVQFIAEGPHLHIWCYNPACGRHVTLAAAEAKAKFGSAWQDFPKLNRILVCSCGARARLKKVRAFPCTFDDSIESYRDSIARQLEKYGEVSSQPLVLPGLGEIHPEDVGFPNAPRPKPWSSKSERS